MEGDILDFKAKAYNLSDENSKVSLIKDILSFANTPRKKEALIVLGVKKYPDGSYNLVGIDKALDEADIQSQFTERVFPIPQFFYSVFEHEGKQFGIIKIPVSKDGPYIPIKDVGNGIRRGQIYFRRGSKNDCAVTHEDYFRILHTVENADELVAPTGENLNPVWEDLMESVHGFKNTRSYILLASPFSGKELNYLKPVSLIPWSAVFDFDPESDSSGLLYQIKADLIKYRSLHLAISHEYLPFNPERATYWFFTRGLEGRQNTIQVGAWKEWVKHSKAELNQQFNRLASSLLPSPITCIALWYNENLSLHLRSTLEAVLSSFGDSVEIVIVTHNDGNLMHVADEFDAKLVNIPLNQLCSGLESYLVSGDSDRWVIPSSSGAPVSLPVQDQRWLEEELEIVHLDVGLKPSKERNVGRDFLRGSNITWYELGLHYDVDRDIVSKLKPQIEYDLKQRRSVRVNIYHAPGAGGTTVARRVLWDFHKTFPCAILNRTNPPDTAERLYKLCSLTGQPALLLVDGSKIAERQVEELFNILRSRHIPVVILQVLRRFKKQSEAKRAFYLTKELSQEEAYRFLHVFSREKPEKEKELEQLITLPDPRVRTPFYFGLQTFGRNFLGLEPYVNARISALGSIQRKVMVFLALAHHYGQKAIPAQAFNKLFGLPKTKTIDFKEALGDEAFDLVVEDKKGIYRTAHDLLATETLEQLICPPNTDRLNWRQNLSIWAVEFAKFCRGDEPVPSEEMLEIVRRVFIYRDNTDLLGKEQSANRLFAELFEDIPSREGKLEVLRALTDVYYEEAHFWAHLGRFYSIEMQYFDDALDCINKAISLQTKDHVLHHMKGMVFRSKIRQLIDNKGDLEDIVQLCKMASDSFETSREQKPEDEHGYISEVQLLITVFDYAGSRHPDGLLNYIMLPDTDPFLRNSLERAEDLLEQVRRNREGEGSNPYEEDCRAKLDSLYGDHGKALQIWDNLLNRQTVYSPPIRRQIVWTYLARKNRSWDSLATRELERIITLLDDNLQEEPNNDRNLRLWVQAVRRSKHPRSIEAVIERVAYWKSNADTIDAVYYLYVLYTLLAIEGSVIARDEAMRHLDECRYRARFRRNRTKSFEWIGVGTGLAKLVHHSQLGEWDLELGFWNKTEMLLPIKGRISKIHAPQAGEIELDCGMRVFFVPARGEFSRNRSENLPVEFYLGFSYDGLRAWQVKESL